MRITPHIEGDDVYDRDQYKKNLAISKGFDILVIWDFEIDKEKIVEDFIKKNMKKI